MAKNKDIETKIEEKIAFQLMADFQLRYPDIEETEEIIAFYRLQREAYKYARGFFNLLRPYSRHYIDSGILPIIFRDAEAARKESMETGRICSPDAFSSVDDSKQAVIYIGLPRLKEFSFHPLLKKFIRHEVIHYYLWLNDLPCDDDSALFWAYSNIYDGNAYEKMDKEEKVKYNEFIKQKKQYPDADYTMLKILAEAVIMDDDERMKLFRELYSNRQANAM